ncbi:MAG: hypothetical protein IPP07_08350 [Holophagales bacterium]|nr:hypothetical protein [Holophagales bacterium]
MSNYVAYALNRTSDAECNGRHCAIRFGQMADPGTWCRRRSIGPWCAGRRPAGSSSTFLDNSYHVAAVTVPDLFHFVPNFAALASSTPYVGACR